MFSIVGGQMDTVSAFQDRALELCTWLERIPRTYAAPVVVRIGREVYAGATYAQVRDTHEGTAAYASGERFNASHMMYLIGRLPYSYRRSRSTCYALPGARFPWYVAGWYDTEAITEYHPFGPMFLLACDKEDVCTRDDGTPYDRKPLELIG